MTQSPRRMVRSGCTKSRSMANRAQVHVHRDHVSVYSRSGYDWTEQCGQIARGETLSTDELIIDGEVTVLGNTGLIASLARPGGNLVVGLLVVTPGDRKSVV